MINPRILNVCYKLDEWCDKNHILYNVVVDEANLQGIVLHGGNRQNTSKLTSFLRPFAHREKIHLESRIVRGGSVLALSVTAISENTMSLIISNISEVLSEMSFEDKLQKAFSATPAETAPKTKTSIPLQQSMLKTAMRIVAVEAESKEQKTLPAVIADSFEDRLSKTMTGKGAARFSRFNNRLFETLEGMATPTGQQPSDLFSKFANALAVLGKQMGVGPLQDVLKQRGINWKKSDDGQSVVLYVLNASTKAPMPIARVSSASLEKPNEFQKQLLSIIDFSQGEAPGAFEQQKMEIQTKEKAVRDIASALGPQDDNSVQNQMQNPIAQQMAQGAAQPAAPAAPAQPAPAAPAAPAKPSAAPAVSAKPTPRQAATPAKTQSVGMFAKPTR